MILGNVMVPGKSYACDVCGYPWVSIARRKPEFCPNRDCRSREWDGRKTKRKPVRQPSIALPKPIKIRTANEDLEF
jgi:hypothetical protein